METSLTAAIGLGFLLGVRHAMDADHLAAVSSLVSEQSSIRRSCLLGTFWGVGHTTALLIAGLALIAFKLTISPELEERFEKVVGVVLVLLGGHVLLRSVAALSLHRHLHAHESSLLHPHAHLHVGRDGSHRHGHLLTPGRRSFLVGLVHGMAGSAALTLVVLASIPSAVGRMLYILLFGVGSTAGMLLLSGLIGVPFAWTSGRSELANVAIRIVAGALSVTLGVLMLRD